MSIADKSWWDIALEREVIKRSLKTSLIVGSILAMINHGDALLALDMPLDRVIKMVLTYAVPYLVSTSASIGAIRHHDKIQQ
ncbi:MAG: nitrate/nitrite transporter NrtS [Oleispira sp.]